MGTDYCIHIVKLLVATL